MATALAPREEPLLPIAEMPATKAATQRLGEIRHELGTARAEFARYARALNPIIDTGESPADRRDAVQNIDRVRLRCAALEDDEAEAIQIATVARAFDEETLRARFLTLMRAQMARVVPALRAAEKEMMALQAIESRAQELVGNVDRVAWTTLCVNDAGEHALDTWIAYVKRAGLID